MTTLSLEQCRKLKEWGYPQEGCSYFYHGDTVYVGGKNYVPTGDWYACPALEELILWITEGKRNSFYLQYDDEWTTYEEPLRPGNAWSARYYPLTPAAYYEESRSSPLEAVYSLCEALYGKEGG